MAEAARGLLRAHLCADPAQHVPGPAPGFSCAGAGPQPELPGILGPEGHGASSEQSPQPLNTCQVAAAEQQSGWE